MAVNDVTQTDSKKRSTFYQVLKLFVPTTTPWDPAVSEQLMTGLFSLQVPMKLEIGAAANKIQWAIVVPRGNERAVVNYIYSLFPRAQVEIESKTAAPVGYWLYHLHSAAPFIGPIKFASDFGNIDPLPGILMAMSQLRNKEQLIYELSLSPARDVQYKLGEKLITQSTIKWWHFLHVGWAADAAAKKAFGADKKDKYVPEIQKMARAKLNAPLKEVSFAIKVKSSSAQRADHLIGLFEPALASFDRDGFNMVVPAQEKSFSLVLSAPEAAALWHLPTDQCQVQGIVWASAPASPLPAAITRQYKGVRLGVNIYQGRQQDVRLPFADRVTHVNIVGKTRVGKSTLIHHLVHQDIAAGKGVGVIDPHGQLVDNILAASIPPEREQDVVLFDINDQDFPIGLNMLSSMDGLSPSVVAGQVLAVIRKMFADSWSSSRMEDALHAALTASFFIEEATIQSIPKLFYDSSFRAQALQNVTDPVALEFWYDEYEPLSAAYQREFARPITHRLRKFYRNEAIRPVVCQSQSLNFREIIDQGKIFLAKPGGIADIDAETLGALLISKFQLAAMSRGGRSTEALPEFYLHVDEVQSFVTTSLDKMFSEAGKFGLRLVVANQYLKQLEGSTLEAVMGNTGTTVIFRVGPQDSRALAPFVKPNHGADDLVNLDRFTTVVKMQVAGQTLPAFSMDTLEPIPWPGDAAERMARILALSREAYGRPRAEVEAELLARFRQEGSKTIDEADDEVSYLG